MSPTGSRPALDPGRPDGPPGRYVPVERLPDGVAGPVWRARDTVRDRPVVVHEVHGIRDAQGDPAHGAAREELERAARARAPALVPVLEVLDDGQRLQLVSEDVMGEPLTAVLRRDGTIAPAQVAAVGLAVLDALDAAAAVGAVHGDLRPGAVLVRTDGQPVVTGLGLAAAAERARGGARGSVVGAPAYGAPERLRGRPAGEPGDLWSLGALLATLLDGRPPFPTGPGADTVGAVLRGAPRLPGHAPPELTGLVATLLSQDPARRPDRSRVRATLAAAAPAAEAPHADAALHADAAPQVPAAPGAAPRAGRAAGAAPLRQSPATTSGRRRRAITAAALGVGLVAAGTAALALRPHDDPGPRAAPASALAPVRTPSAGPSPQVPPAAAAAAAESPLPAGWRRYRPADAAWSLGLPPGWSARGTGADTRLTSGSGATTGRVLVLPVGDRPPEAQLPALEESFGATHPGYRRLSFGITEQAGRRTAQWEYVFGTGAQARHARDVAVLDGPHLYVLHVESSPAAWPAAAPLQDGLRASLRTAG